MIRSQRNRTTPLIFILALLVVAGCGDDDSDSTVVTSTVDPTSASSCAELADVLIAAAQAYIDVLGERPLDDTWGLTPEDEVPQDLLEGGGRYSQAFAAVGERSVELDCEEAMDDLICERQPQLELRGGASEGFIHESTPCGLVGTLGTEAGAEAEARIDAWLEERAD